MKEIQVNLETEKAIDVTGSYKNAYYTKSVVNYLSGIPKFDNLLEGRKFAETKYQLNIVNYEKFFSFVIYLDNKPVSFFHLAKSDIRDISLQKDRPVEIDTLGDKEEKLGGLAALAPIVGVTAIAGDSISNAIKKDKIYIKSTEYAKGCIYEIHVDDELNHKIVLTTLDGNFLESMNTFFSKALEINFSGKFDPKKEENKNCYIATLCYGNQDAVQVLTFRDYRDKVLNKSFLGKIFVRVYYNISPKLIPYLKNKEQINKLIRTLILDRIYRRLK
ncbi:MAG: hypothetical protein BGO53_02260 [Sphingobacteriales bacterium 39-19]|nr:hypothetical protein [Sphingobacteriales bacterium]OJW11190.1 MAG: hypothetical protein BGO53_02260 [Sphingobacteriales bacterium 39-19]